MTINEQLSSVLLETSGMVSSRDIRSGITETLGFILTVFRRTHPPQAVAGLQSAIRQQLIEGLMRKAFTSERRKAYPKGTGNRAKGKEIVFSFLHTHVMALINAPGGDLMGVISALADALLFYSDDGDTAANIMREILQVEARLVSTEDGSDQAGAWRPEGVFIVH